MIAAVYQPQIGGPQALTRFTGNLALRRIFALVAGWLSGVIAWIALAALAPAFNEFLGWVPTEVAYIELGKLILFAAGMGVVWTTLTVVDSFFVGLALATSWPLATTLSSLVTGALNLVDVHDGTLYFIALNLTFLVLQVAIVFTWAGLRKYGTAVAP